MSCLKCQSIKNEHGAYPPFCAECGRSMPTTCSIGTEPDGTALAVGYKVKSKEYMHHRMTGERVFMWYYVAELEHAAPDGGEGA